MTFEVGTEKVKQNAWGKPIYQNWMIETEMMFLKTDF